MDIKKLELLLIVEGIANEFLPDDDEEDEIGEADESKERLDSTFRKSGVEDLHPGGDNHGGEENLATNKNWTDARNDVSWKLLWIRERLQLAWFKCLMNLCLFLRLVCIKLF